MNEETRIFLICGCMLLIFILVAVVIPLLPETICGIRDRVKYKKQREKCKKFGCRITGEIIGEEEHKRPNAHLIFDMLNRNVRYKVMLEEGVYNYHNLYYSPIVRYEVDGKNYEVNAHQYFSVKPIKGQKALVFYNRHDPADAAVDNSRKYRQPLKIQKRDEYNIYCTCGLKKNIVIPCSEVDENALPGRTLVHRYGVYSLDLQSAIKAKGPLTVEKADEDFTYCKYRLKKDILVPRKEIANGTPKPGDKIIYKYEYFYIKLGYYKL